MALDMSIPNRKRLVFDNWRPAPGEDDSGVLFYSDVVRQAELEINWAINNEVGLIDLLNKQHELPQLSPAALLALTSGSTAAEYLDEIRHILVTRILSDNGIL